MKIWLIGRTFIAFFLILFGLHFVFSPSEQLLLAGSAIAAVGFTFLLLLWLEVRRTQR